MEDKKEKLKICRRCNKEIGKDEKGVTWITFEGKKILEEVHFHWNCFIEWRNESLENRARQLYVDSMKKTIPQFQNLMKQIYNGRETTEGSLY
jgi:streptogramin lyase